MLKAVVFDLDGTLLDTIPDIAAALNAALEACGLPTHSVRDIEGFVGGGIVDAVRKASPAGTPEETLERILDLYRGRYTCHCTDLTKPYPGVEALLETLAARGVALGVLSNKTEESVREIVSHYFPEIPFACVHGRVEGRALKPDRGAAAPVLETLGLAPAEITYVGDSGTDMTFARAVGMTAVGVPWGYRSREQLVESGAAWVTDSAAQLQEQLLEKLEG